MSKGSATAQVSSTSAAPATMSSLTLVELRASRRNARSQLELAQLRARQSRDVDEGTIVTLKAWVDALTEELISRYERDPGLIDLILVEGPSSGEARP
jgi:hypothetical protein